MVIYTEPGTRPAQTVRQHAVSPLPDDWRLLCPAYEYWPSAWERAAVADNRSEVPLSEWRQA